jgi:predicted O-methyltransferase YrrM
MELDAKSAILGTPSVAVTPNKQNPLGLARRSGGASGPRSLLAYDRSLNWASEDYYYESAFAQSTSRGPTLLPMPCPATPEYLDSFEIVGFRGSFGQLGLAGSLGYEGKHVSVKGYCYRHALSANGPAAVTVRLDGQPRRFECLVAINDDVLPGASSADFIVAVGGRMVAGTFGMTAGDPPRAIAAELGTALEIELRVTTGDPTFCHAVWLDPAVPVSDSSDPSTSIVDCLRGTEIVVPSRPLCSDRCIVTIASRDFKSLLDDMLGSLVANGNCQDALLVVVCPGEPSTIAAVAAKYGATLIQCNPRRAMPMRWKSALYSVARLIDANHFLILDSDILVLGDLRPIFGAIQACPDGAILVCREDNGRSFRSLGDAFQRIYRGSPSQAHDLFDEESAAYPLVVNDGVFAGARQALIALDSQMRAMPRLHDWLDTPVAARLGNQFIFNLALAQSGSGIELDPIYNLQVQRGRVRMDYDGARIRGKWKGKPVAVVHFNGDGRHKHPNWRNVYARVPDPLVGPGHGDGYAEFLAVLRAWAGMRGMGALTWSSCGEPERYSDQTREVSTLPVLALLHYLLRSNGCVRMIQIGTGRGISAACMASAVAHRAGARVVTIGPRHFPDRDDLWAALPVAMRSCLEARLIGSLEGMRCAMDNGESYEAALLDSIQTAENLWAEFDLARQLVWPGGLILVTNASYEGATVGEALERIQAAGYGVVRLWTAGERIADDCGKLGLAVIENRVYTRTGEVSDVVPPRV